MTEETFSEAESPQDQPRLSVSPSRKRLRSRVTDSDDDSDYSEASQSPHTSARKSLSPCPSPKRWVENSFSTPIRRRIVPEGTEELKADLQTSTTQSLKVQVWQRYWMSL
jgi:hypothetical protein